MAKRSGLGKGLEALFLDNSAEDGAVTQIKVSQIEPNQSQPRAAFDDEGLRELADSIRSHGVIQPLVVRPLERGGYQIVAGERRWRACRMAGLTEVPVIIRELDDGEALAIAIVENLQREDLNAIELAYGYRRLMDQYGLTQEQVAEKLGKSRPVVANTIRLLALPPTVQEQVRQGKISPGHARALVSLEDQALIEQTAKRILSDRLLVRDIERMAQSRNADGEKKPGKESPEHGSHRDTAARSRTFRKEIELALTAELGRKVSISSHGKKYVLEVEFYTDEELAELAARLSRSH